MAKRQIRLSGVMDSYQVVDQVRYTFVIPALIGALFVGLLVFFFQSKRPPAEEAELVEVAEVDPEPIVEEIEEPVSPTEIEPEPLVEKEEPIERDAMEVIDDAVAHNESMFTDWMTISDIDAYIKLLNSGHQKSFWERGHWIIAVEGRWELGDQQYRIAWESMPRNSKYQWRYKVNQSQEDFSKAIDELAKQGFKLVHSQSFKRPDQTERFQGVWQNLGGKKKAGKLTSSKPAQRSVKKAPPAKPKPKPKNIAASALPEAAKKREQVTPPEEVVETGRPVVVKRPREVVTNSKPVPTTEEPIQKAIPVSRESVLSSSTEEEVELSDVLGFRGAVE